MAELMSCVWCMSVWAGAVLFFAVRIPFILYVLSASAIAIVIQERVVHHKQV